jgi:hypothetical protein
LQYSRIFPEALCKNRENRRKHREDANENHKPGDVQVIEQHFVDGHSVNAYVAVQKTTINGLSIARIQVGPRGQLSFLKKDGRPVLYVRSGNRSVPVRFEQIEYFFSLRRLY